jgi:hypothetical protein
MSVCWTVQFALRSEDRNIEPWQLLADGVRKRKRGAAGTCNTFEIVL